jgi:hypothetical protein
MSLNVKDSVALLANATLAFEVRANQAEERNIIAPVIHTRSTSTPSPRLALKQRHVARQNVPIGAYRGACAISHTKFRAIPIKNTVPGSRAIRIASPDEVCSVTVRRQSL